VKPGPAMGALLKESFEAQLDGEFSDLPSAITWAKTRLETDPTWISPSLPAQTF